MKHRDLKGVGKMKEVVQPVTIEQLASGLFSSIHNYTRSMFAAGITIQADNFEILQAFAWSIRMVKKGNTDRFPYSALVSLRIISRNSRKVRRKVDEQKRELEKSKLQLERLLSTVAVPKKLKTRIGDLLIIAEKALTARDIGKGLDTAELIKKLFDLGLEMDREGLLQVITLDRNREIKYKIPERVDLIRLKRLVIHERLEDPEDAYLLEALQ